jgi:hypothetical protein
MRQITLKKPVASVSSLGGSGLVAFAATLVCFMSAAPLSAQGSTNVFNDAVFWFRGGKDINSDGYIQQGEFFDDLHANDTSHANHNATMTSYSGQTGGHSHSVFAGNAAFATEQVVFPALGNNVVENMQVLHISNEAKQINNTNFYFPFDVNPHSIFEDNDISNEYTIVSRIRLDHDGYSYNTCFAKVGYDVSSNKGMWLGFSKSYSAYPGCMRVAAYRTPKSGGSDTGVYFDLPVPTNTWVDLAVVVGNGKLRVGVAAPVSLASHNNNPTIAFDQKEMWTDNCTLLTSEHYKLFCGDGQTAPAQASSADKSCFSGSVQQLAIWGRALSDQEVMEAFGMPRPTIFRIGLDNAASNEFGGTRTGSTQTIDGLGSWQNIANKMEVGDVWTVNFNALRDEANLPQIFSIKSLSGSAAAQIEAKLNGTSLGEGRIAANTRVFWPVAANLVRAGANTLVIERKNGGGHDFLMDAMELGGSLGVGKMTASSSDDGRVDPNLIKTGVPSAADPNPQHWPTKLEPSTDIDDLHFRVWIDPDVADKASFTLKTAVKCDANSTTEKFIPYVNRVKKGDVYAADSWKQLSLSFKAGDLLGGWNDIDFYSTDSRCWEFGYYRFETVMPSPFGFSKWPPLMIVIR